MSVADRDARLQASVYRTFGEAAEWDPVAGGEKLPVTVIRLTDTEMQDFGQGQVIVGTAIFRVRPTEVAAPREGDFLRIPARAEAYSIIGEPIRTRFGLDWVCQAQTEAF
jgi:hypothetical protein